MSKKFKKIIISSIFAIGVFLSIFNVSYSAFDGNSWNERQGTYLETVWHEGRNILINGLNKYLNFGIVSGTSGYGFRDNSGTMEFKNSGGSWASFGSGTGTSTGTVTSVGIAVPTGLSVSNTPITTSGTTTIGVESGYEIPQTASTTNWESAFVWGDHALAGYYDTALDVIGGFTGCSGTMYLGADGACHTDQLGSGGGATTTINGVDGPTFTFATSSDTNIGLTISPTLTFTPSWIGTLADGRIASASNWNAAFASTTALTPTYLRGLFSETTTGLDYSAGVFSLTSGYFIPLTASSTEWNAKADYSFGANNFLGTGNFNTSGTINATTSLTTNATSTNFGVTGTFNMLGQFFSNLAAFVTYIQTLITENITGLAFSGGQLSLESGYEITKTASSTNWNGFWDVPSTRITDGAGLTWSGNTLNCDVASGSVAGCLSTTNWTTFNGKQDAITAGTGLSWAANTLNWSSTGLDWTGNAITNGYIASSTEYLIDNNTTYTAGDGLTLTSTDFDCDTASGSVFGCLSTTDWNTFNNKADTDTNTTYTATSPITLTGTAFGIESASTTNWDTAYGWGDWSGEGFITNAVATLASLTSVGTIETGVWQGTAIDNAYIASSTEYLADNNTTYLGGTNLTLSGSTFNVDDAFVLNTGDTMSGDLTVTGTTTSAYASITTGISLLGEYFTNFTNYVRSLFTGGDHVTITSGSIAVDDDFLLNNGDIGTGVYDFGGATSLEIPNASAPTVDTLGEIGLDTTDDQLIVMGASAKVIPTTMRIWSATVASTSPAFINAGLLKIPTQLDGYTMTNIRCSVQGTTSKIIAIEDEDTNSTEDITCAASVTSDDGSIANATVTAGEEMYIDFGASGDTPDYVSISVFGTWTRE
jgi:hypothetical protein